MEQTNSIYLQLAGKCHETILAFWVLPSHQSHSLPHLEVGFWSAVHMSDGSMTWTKHELPLLNTANSYCRGYYYVPLKRSVQVLTASTWPYLKMGSFADIIKLRQGHSGLEWALNPVTDVFIRERWGIFRHWGTQREGHVTAERKTGLMSLEARFPRWLSSKESACQCRRYSRHGFDPWSGRSPGEGHGNPLQYSHLENSMDRGENPMDSPWGLKRVGHHLATKQQQ